MQPPALAASSHLFQSRFLAGEPVDLAVTLTNTTKKPFSLGGAAFEISSYRINIARDDGEQVALTAFGQQQFTPPTAVFANPSLILRPGASRRIVFPLGRLFDLGNGGTFTVSAGRNMESSVRTGPGTYRNESVTFKAAPLRFTIASTPIFETEPSFPTKETLLLSLDGHSPSGRNQAEIAALRLKNDGSFSPLLKPVALVPSDSSDLVVSSDGKTAYVAREGVLQAYSVQKNGAFKVLGAPIALKQHIYRVALSRTKRVIVYGNWGIQDFAVQANGTLRPRPQTTLVPADYLVWSHDGRIVYLANGSVYSWKVTPQGTLRAVQARFVLGSMPQELFVAPNDRLLLCKTSSFGAVTKESLALVRLDGQGHLLSGAKLWRNDGKFGLHALGFDPSGKFVLAACNKELLVFRVQQGSLQLTSRLDAHLGYDDLKAVWGRANHVLYVVGSHRLRAFHLQDNGRLLPLGAPRGDLSDSRAISLVDIPIVPETFGTPNVKGTAYLESQVCAPETPVWLDLVTSGPPPRLNIVYLGREEYASRGNSSSNLPSVGLLQGGSSLASLPAKARVDLARLFDLSLDGIYVLKIVPSSGQAREIRFKIEDARYSISFDRGDISPAETRAWRFDVMRQ